MILYEIMELGTGKKISAIYSCLFEMMGWKVG